MMCPIEHAFRCVSHRAPWAVHRLRVSVTKTLWPDRLSGFPFSCRTMGGIGQKAFAVFQSLGLLLLAACASPPERPLSLNAPLYATLPNGFEPLNPGRPASIYAEVLTVPGDNLIRYLERKRGHALNLLSLSGGGQNGAFGAGFTSLAGAKADGGRSSISSVVLAPVRC
jgi:hypothetical protein